MFNTDQHLISILGTTATGKTKLALYLAEKLIQEKRTEGVCLISADSRQVYQGLEILTGADIPPNFKFQKSLNSQHSYRFLQHSQLPISLHGVSIIQPEDEWSVAHFRNIAIELINQAWQKNWMPIIVGGTSFYHKQLFNNDPDIYIKPNAELRTKLEKLSLKQLQQKLQKINQQKWQEMNQSDQANPRRLIRAIEITQVLASKPISNNKTTNNHPVFTKPKQYFSIGLSIDEKSLTQKIIKRVNTRFNNGAVTEVEKLLALSLKPNTPVLTTLGVEPLMAFLTGTKSSRETVQFWTQQELQYAKRQLTWINKINISAQLDVNQPDYQQTVWRKINQAILKFKQC